MEIEYKSIDEITPYENNPRNNDEAAEYVAKSIKEFGFKNPIIIDKDNVIVAGHTRLKAAKKLGIEKVPCIRATDLTEEQIKAFRLADNKVSEIATWDLEKLSLELKEINLDMQDFGFDELEMEDITLDDEEQEIIEDEIPEAPEEPKAKYGEIYQLGKHRLMCGDSTKKEDLEKLMNGVKADLVFTDPPYGMKKEKDGILNDNLNSNDLLEFNKQWFYLTLDTLKDTGCLYCWGIDEPLMDMYSGILKPLKKANKLVVRNYITWAKHSSRGINSGLALSYPKETEKCWFIMKGMDWRNNNTEFFNTKFQPILDYMQGEAQKAGITPKDIQNVCGVQMFSHWFSKSKFSIIPKNHYEKLQNHYGGFFPKDYDELRKMIGISNNPTECLKPYFDSVAIDNVGDIGLTDVWRFNQTSNKERETAGGHATPKPIALCARGIHASSRKGEIVLDVFGGSGSTLIACEQLNRKCYVMELEPKYIDVIIERWENLTGQKAVKLEETQ